MKVTVLTKQHSWLALEEDWLRLQSLAKSCPFRSWELFSLSSELWNQLVIFEINEVVVGIVPIQQTKKLYWSTMGYRDYNYACFVGDPQYCGEMIEAFSQWLRKSRRCFVWRGFRSWDSFDQEWKWQVERVFTHVAAYQVPTYSLDFDAVDSKYLSTKAKKHSLKRREKRLRCQGEVSWGLIDCEEFERILALHEARWQGRRDTSGVETELKQQWLYNLWSNSSETTVHVYGLKLDGRLIAFQWDFIADDRIIGYWTGFDPEYSSYAPGFILLLKTMEVLKEQNFRVFDFSIGYESYKEYWATHEDHSSLLVTAPQNQWLSYSAMKYFMEMRSWMKSKPSLVQFIRTKGKKVGGFVHDK